MDVDRGRRLNAWEVEWQRHDWLADVIANGVGLEQYQTDGWEERAIARISNAVAVIVSARKLKSRALDEARMDLAGDISIQGALTIHAGPIVACLMAALADAPDVAKHEILIQVLVAVFGFPDTRTTYPDGRAPLAEVFDAVAPYSSMLKALALSDDAKVRTNALRIWAEVAEPTATELAELATQSEGHSLDDRWRQTLTRCIDRAEARRDS